MKNYQDMLHMPHPTSKKHPRMSLEKRAAQFAPFAALTGYDGEISEAGRLTEKRIELSDLEKDALDLKLQWIMAHREDRPEISITYFLPDSRKEGGAYETVVGIVRKIHPSEKCMVLEEETIIPMEEIISLELPVGM